MQEAASSEEKNSVTYEETAYQDASYPIVGEPPKYVSFTPMTLSVMKGDRSVVDSMFRDYGGIDQESKEVRWHLPEGLRHVETSVKESKDESDQKELEDNQKLMQELREQAYEEGRQSALAESKAQLDEHSKQINARMSELLRDMTKQLQERIAIIEKKSVQVSLDIANKLVPQAVEVNPEYITTIIREALGLSGAAIIKQIRVSPEDKEFIDVVGLHKSLKEFDGTWEFVADETIRAGCVVDTSAGEVDYDLSKAWERIKDSVMKVLR